MSTVTKRELNQNTADVLARATDEGDVVVTERGRPRWRIVSFQHHDDALTRLEREDLYTPASTSPTPWPDRPGGPAHTESEVDALLDEMRGDH
jgi:prevent-host-death family protein